MKSISSYINEVLKLGKTRDPKTALDKTFNTFEELHSIIKEFLQLDGKYFRISKIQDKDATMKLAPGFSDRVNVIQTFKVDIFRDSQKSAIYRDKTLTVGLSETPLANDEHIIFFKIRYKDDNDKWQEDMLCGFRTQLTGDFLTFGSNFLKWLKQLSKVRLTNKDRILSANKGVLKFFHII